MSSENSNKNNGISRRKFIGGSSALAGGMVLPVGASAYVAGSDILKVALIGCGSRGTGAVRDAMQADDSIELVAMADLFRDQIDRSYEGLMSMDFKDRIKVPDENKFVGLDGYKNAIDAADVVLLVTSPAFRPLHFEYAINADKHVFMEKPLSSDAVGNRRLLAAGKIAEEKGLNAVVGLQNRYTERNRMLIEHLHAGIIGDITAVRCDYLIGGVRLIPRQPGQTEMEYQLRNWRHFNWLWAGATAGLTIHVEDISHWAKGTHPIRANGTGGRVVMSGPEYGDIFDTYNIQYEYPDGARLYSRTRLIEGAWFNRVLEFQGTKGTATTSEITDISGRTLWSYERGEAPSGYQAEHNEFFASIRNGTPINDVQWASKSNMTSIMGRMAAHSGEVIEWDDAFNSDLNLVPDNITFNSTPDKVPGEDGNYPHAIPGSGERVL